MNETWGTPNSRPKNQRGLETFLSSDSRSPARNVRPRISTTVRHSATSSEAPTRPSNARLSSTSSFRRSNASIVFLS